MANWYGLLADLVVLIHFSFVVFVITGGLLVLKRRWWAWLHVPAVIWGVLIEAGGWICPLTYWEQALREKAGAQAYAGDFVTTYIIPILYPAALTRELQWLFAALVIVINLVIYYRVWVSRRVVHSVPAADSPATTTTARHARRSNSRKNADGDP